MGRGGKQKSKPTRGFISEESDDNKEDPKSAGEEAGGEDPVKMNYKEEEDVSREKTVEKDSRGDWREGFKREKQTF